VFATRSPGTSSHDLRALAQYLWSTISIAFLLTLGSGCGSSINPGPTCALGETATINGKIENWRKGDRLPISAWFPEPRPGLVLTVGNVDEDGKLQLVLPGGDTVAPYLRQKLESDLATCPIAPTFTPADLRFVQTFLWVEGPTRSQRLVRATDPKLRPPPPGTKLMILLYSERDGRIAGRHYCNTFGESEGDYDVYLVQGWNCLIDTTLEVMGETRSKGTVRSGPVSEGLHWYMLPPD